MNPAVFLDRDGVIIHNRDNYVRNRNDVEFIPSSLEALKHLSLTSYRIIVISNQSAIGRGIITIEQADAINQFIIEKISDAGGRVDGMYICPHTPEDHCLCRKPHPGLILQAASELAIDLSSSAMIGDALSDIQAGMAAGIKTIIMVKTGRGQEQLQLPQLTIYPHIIKTDDLLSAISIILSKSVL